MAKAGPATTATKGAGAAGKGKRDTSVREKEKKLVFKAYLQSGLEPQWPVIPDPAAAEIRLKLESVAAATRLPKRKRKGEAIQKGQRAAGPASAASAIPHDTAWGIPRKELVVGVNEVTRGLERDAVALVFVARAPNVDTLTKHLLTLSHLKGTTVCALADIDASLARVAGVGRACTVGIRKLDEGETRSEIAGSLLDHVCARAIPTSIPWLPTAARSQRHAGAGYVEATVKKVGFQSKRRREPKA